MEQQGETTFLIDYVIHWMRILQKTVEYFTNPFTETAIIIKKFVDSLLKPDEDIENLVQEHQKKYLAIGWNIFCWCYIVMFAISSVILAILTESGDPLRFRTLVIGTIF